MFGLAFWSMTGNSAIMDEVAHIPAGYSYLHFGDYRLNPEHPPLMKDLAGLPLQFMNLKFPVDVPAWATDINGQWEAGWHFLYHVGNDAAAILFWSRLPILLVAVAFGAWLYWFVRRKWGVAVALLTLVFYALSPNILAHSTLVTTDVGATVFIFLGLVAFVHYVERPTWRRFGLLALAILMAELAKFSAVLLYPFLGVLSLVLVAVMPQPRHWVERLRVYVGGLVGASAVSMLGVWLAYAPQTWNMSQDMQDKLIIGSISDDRVKWLAYMMVHWNDWAIFKPMVQYLLGVVMVFGRVNGGNVTYFDGMVNNQSFFWYFPELFVVKTQVALLILLLAVLGVTAWRVWRTPVGRMGIELAKHFRGHLMEWTIALFALFYVYISVTGNLNLGIRHILPIYVPLFVLVAIGTVRLWRAAGARVGRVVASGVLMALVSWYGVGTALAAPYFIPYFNELVGGPSQAYKYFSDSSVDWGQDLVRLQNYVDEHPEIHKIAVDYFGGGSPQYYFCKHVEGSKYDCADSKYEEWHAQQGRYPGQYIAVSETFLENDKWYAEKDDRPGYAYLRDMEPVAKIGYSIYVYKLYEDAK
jgi:hypothetical protein